MTERTSVWFRALHKSASMFVHKYSLELVNQLGESWQLFSANNTPANRNEAENAPHSAITCARDFRPVPRWALDGRKVINIIQLRDPRDILVSEYYSLGFIHGDRRFKPKAQTTRAEIQSGEMTIDDYVLYSATEEAILFGSTPLRDRMVVELDALIARLARQDLPLTIVRYEDMVLSYPKWSETVLGALGLGNAELADHMASKFAHEFDLDEYRDRADQMSHKRTIVPGDHKRKLQPQTIDKLNEIFAPILLRYYSPD